MIALYKGLNIQGNISIFNEENMKWQWVTMNVSDTYNIKPI